MFLLRPFVLASFSLATVAQPTISAHVNEVHVLLHAEDAAHHTISDLALTEIELHDNGKQQKQITALIPRTSLPLRLGLMFDTSGSMLGYPIIRSRNIARILVQHLLHPAMDTAFTQAFDFADMPSQPFTSDRTELGNSIEHIADYARSRIGGTALYDAIYRACRDRFEPIGNGDTANAIIVFTDGGDNASHAYLHEVISECQSVRTAVFIFTPAESKRYAGKNLQLLAEQSGGAVFLDRNANLSSYLANASVERSQIGIRQETLDDLDELVRRLRNQYELVYKPNNLKPNGSFHRIEVKTPYRRINLFARTGYYAPGK